MVKALAIITNDGEKNKNKDKEEVISPLLVLEILQSKPKLKFTVIKDYLLNRLAVKDRIIRKNKEKVEENIAKIKGMR